MNEVDSLIREMRRDHQGRYPEDPLYKLPHSKCSCGLCVDWRSKWAGRIALTETREAK